MGSNVVCLILKVVVYLYSVFLRLYPYFQMANKGNTGNSVITAAALAIVSSKEQESSTNGDREK